MRRWRGLGPQPPSPDRDRMAPLRGARLLRWRFVALVTDRRALTTLAMIAESMLEIVELSRKWVPPDRMPCLKEPLCSTRIAVWLLLTGVAMTGTGVDARAASAWSVEVNALAIGRAPPAMGARFRCRRAPTAARRHGGLVERGATKYCPRVTAMTPSAIVDRVRVDAVGLDSEFGDQA